MSLATAAEIIEAEFDLIRSFARLAVVTRRAERGRIEDGPYRLLEHEIDLFLEIDDAPAFETILEELTERRSRLREADNTPMAHLASLFELRPWQCDVILACLAPQLDARFGYVYAYLQDDLSRTRPTPLLLQRLLTSELSQRLELCRFLEQHPFFWKWRLGRFERGPAGEINAVLASPRLVSFLRGISDLAPEGATFLDILNPVDACPEGLAPATRRAVENLIGRLLAEGRVAVANLIDFRGPQGSGRRETAVYCCTRLGMSAMHLDLDRLGTEDLEGRLAIAIREALVCNAGLIVSGLDRARDNDLVPRLLRGVGRYCRFCFLVHEKPVTVAEPEPLQRHIRVAFRLPDVQTRTAVWQKHLDRIEARPERMTAARLAELFRFSEGRIARAVRAAAAEHLLAADEEPLADDHLLAGCRAQAGDRLDSLARRVRSAYRWDDLILPDHHKRHLRELMVYFRNKACVMERWGFDRKISKKGVHVLFFGPPGTGKTMAAGIIARELGLEMYHIDLSTIVSKYIGETEKNLASVFDEAEAANAILFFDEADALFGKRGETKDSHDRYANIEVSYLLQRMETFEGITILASNLRENMDQAFTRRLHNISELPFPDRDCRERIWENAFGTNTPKGGVDNPFLAGIRLSGGEIKNIALLAAAFAAEMNEPVRMTHVMPALMRELEKTGKPLVASDLVPYEALARPLDF